MGPEVEWAAQAVLWAVVLNAGGWALGVGLRMVSISRRRR